MKTNSEQIDKQLEAIKKRLIKSDDFVDLSSIRRLFRPNLSEKVAKDRLLKLRDSESEFYLVGDEKLGYKFIERVDTNLSLKKQEKDNYKYLKDKKINPLYEPRILNNITQLYRAMQDKFYVELINYAPVNAGKNKDYFVAPLTLVIDDTPFIRAYDRHANKVKRFNIDGIGKVVVMEEKLNSSHLKILNQEVIDDFGFHTDTSQIWEVELLLTNYAKKMFIRDFRFLGEKDKIKTLKSPMPAEVINGEEYYFQHSIRLKVGSIRVIGRLMTGMLSYVKVRNAPEEFKKALTEYIQNTVINALKTNI